MVNGKKNGLATDIEWIKKTLDEIKESVKSVPSLKVQTKFQWWLLGGASLAIIIEFAKELFRRG